MVYPVSCTAVCYATVIALFIKKVGVVRPIFFWGGGWTLPPRPPVVAPLGVTAHVYVTGGGGRYDFLKISLLLLFRLFQMPADRLSPIQFTTPGVTKLGSFVDRRRRLVKTSSVVTNVLGHSAGKERQRR